MVERFRCAHEARTSGEPQYATASIVRRWLLIEQSGPWGADAVVQNRMPDATTRALVELGRRLPARVLLIRRHGDRGSDGCMAYAAVTGVHTRWAESFALDAPADVLDLDLSGIARGVSVGGRPETEPLLLVCTNGRHDACCAEFGRPVASALAAAFGEQVWEVSHIGGDRFAGNLVLLPDGIYYGRLDPDRAVAVAGAHRAGRIDLGAYRGRTAYPFVVQAAEFFLRRERALDGIDALAWTGRTRLADDRWRVTFSTPTDALAVDVAVGQEAEPRQLTCGAQRLVRPPRYDLLALRSAA